MRGSLTRPTMTIAQRCLAVGNRHARSVTWPSQGSPPMARRSHPSRAAQSLAMCPSSLVPSTSCRTSPKASCERWPTHVSDWARRSPRGHGGDRRHRRQQRDEWPVKGKIAHSKAVTGARIAAWVSTVVGSRANASGSATSPAGCRTCASCARAWPWSTPWLTVVVAPKRR
jgi:hypothetical protein